MPLTQDAARPPSPAAFTLGEGQSPSAEPDAGLWFGVLRPPAKNVASNTQAVGTLKYAASPGQVNHDPHRQSPKKQHA